MSQLITVLFSPILSRVYDHGDFGIFASYNSTVMILSIICCGRFELAVVIPEKVQKSFSIVLLCLNISFAVALVAFLGLLLTHLFYNLIDIVFVALIPPIIVLTAINISLNYFHNKITNFKINSAGRVIQSFVTGVVCVLFSNVGIVNGLIVGSFVGQCCVSLYLVINLPSEFSSSLFKIYHPNHFRELFLEHKQFPKHSLFPSFLNVFSSQAINYFLLYGFGAVTTGFYFFTSRVVLLPSSLISSSFSDVFFQNIVKKRREFQPLLPFVIQNILILFGAGFVFAVFFYFFGTIIFSIAFGEKWLPAGGIIKILVFGLLIKFVVSPLTIVFTALDKIQLGALWQYFYFASYIGILMLLYFFKFEFYQSLIFITGYEFIIYLIALYLIVNEVRLHDISLNH